MCVCVCVCVCAHTYLFIWWRWGFLFSSCNLKTRSPKGRGPGPVRGVKMISFSVSSSLSCSAICRKHGFHSQSCHVAIKWPQELMTSVFLARKIKDRVGGRRQKNTFLLSFPLLRIIFIFFSLSFTFFFNFYFYFILLYNTVLVLPYIDMNHSLNWCWQ